MAQPASLMERIVVTGGSGLLGSHLLPLLKGRQVTVFNRDDFDLSGQPDGSALPEKVDAVVCLAQSRRFREFPDGATDIFSVNTAQVLGMLDYARRAGAKSFVFTSSGGVYGSGDHPFTEEDPLAPAGELGFYLTTKLCAEAVVREFAPFMNIAVLRPFFIYGAGQLRSMLMPRLVDKVRAGRPVQLQGQEGIKINPIHALDAALAVKAAMGLQGLEIVNVAGPEVLTLRRICEIIGRRLGIEPVFDANLSVQPHHIIGGTAKMARLLHRPVERFEGRVAELIRANPQKRLDNP